MANPRPPTPGLTLHYDYLDRLTTAYYGDINSTGTPTTDNKYQENISYADARGNIQSINRRGMYKDPFSATCFTNGVIDNLTYSYNYASDRIQKIADATANTAAKAQGFNPGNATGASTYSYDANGNLISDPYKGISGMTVTYNHLNLPASMNFGSDGSLAILYDHAGKKLRKTVSPTTSAGYTQDYVYGLEYRTNGGGGTLTLEAIYHAEGRITPLSGSNYQYEYTIKDHLGNARLSFADLNANSIVDVPGDILQENHYYPFGMNMNYGWMNAAALDNRYQYNGKELNDDFGLNWNDYGARWYDAAVGRWWSVDPLAEKYPHWSPFNYVYNNPISFIDPNGQEGIVVSGQPGDHKNREHFMVNGFDRAQKLNRQYKKEGKGETVTWFVYNDGSEGGYDQKTLDKYKEKAEKAGINMQIVSDGDDIIDYVNEKNGDDSRAADLISDFVYFGHATPGDLDIGYVSHRFLDELTNETLDISEFKSEAFSPSSEANLVGGCRTAVDAFFESSVVDQMSKKVGGKTKGSDVRVYFPGGVVSDENLVKHNKGTIVEKKGTGGKKTKK